MSRGIPAPGKQVVSRYCSPLFPLLSVLFYHFLVYLFIIPFSLFSHATNTHTHTQQVPKRVLCSPSLPPLPQPFEDNGLGTWLFLLSSTILPLKQRMKATLNQYCHGKNAEVRQHKHTASLCCPAKPPLWIYMHDAGFLKWIYLKLQGSLKAGAVIFSSPPRSGAGFIGGAMNPASCVRGTFWWWIQVAVPEIALWFGARLMGLFSWCCN